MKAYHTAGKAPSDISVLAQAAVNNGVFKNKTAAEEFINSDELEQSVRDEARKAKEEQGIKTVPHYVFQGEAKPGSKTTDEFIEVSENGTIGSLGMIADMLVAVQAVRHLISKPGKSGLGHGQGKSYRPRYPN